MPSAIDATKPVQGNPTTESVRDNFAAAKSEIEVLQLTAGVGPQGPPGNTGPAGTVDIGTTTTGIPGSNATVTASGTPQARILNFTVPRGDAGTAGGGITETQAVNAVRQGSPTFQEVPLTVAPTFPTTPNIATAAPVVNAGWELVTGGDPIFGPWEHTTGTGVLAFPITITANDIYQIVFTSTATAMTTIAYALYFRIAPTTTTNQQILQQYNQGIGATVSARARQNYTHLVVVPNTGWGGRFGITRVVRAVTQNSSSLAFKDQLVTVRGESCYIGQGGKASSADTYLNTALGFHAMAGTTTSSRNVAIGWESLRSLATSNRNTAVGERSLASSSSGANNTAVGSYAMVSNVTGSNNTGIGLNALFYSNGSNDTACGTNAGQYGGRGNFNTCIGDSALIGNSSSFPSLGNNNTALGANAGRYQGSGTTVLVFSSDSIFLGMNSRAAANSQTNQIVIGYNAIGHGSDTITLGNSAITAIHANVSSISALSDARVKDQVTPADLDTCLAAVRNLPVSQWTWKPIAGVHRNPQATGFMADDIAKVWPTAVTKEDTFLTVRGTDGKPEMTSVQETLDTLGDDDPGATGATPKTETRVIEKTEEFKDLCYVDLSEALPTLWGAVQKLIQQIEELTGGTPPQQPPTPQPQPVPPQPAEPQPTPAPTPRQRRWR